MTKTPAKKRIYVCHIYYHVYVACLKELNLPDKERGGADLALSMMSNNFGNLKDRAGRCGLFDEVFMFSAILTLSVIIYVTGKFITMRWRTD